MTSGETHPPPPQPATRRSFFVRLAASAAGLLLVCFPFAAGLGVLFHPLRRGPRKPTGSDALDVERLVRIGPLDALPADGVPHPFVVVADVADAWTRDAGQRIGTVFVTRTDTDGVPHLSALSATCPHLGCAVEFDADDDRFECPCHESAFATGGEKLFGPSLRGLDPLPVKLIEKDGQTDVWVAYQKFRAGIAERTPTA